MLPDYLNLIGGEQRPAVSGEWLDSVNPTTGEVSGAGPGQRCRGRELRGCCGGGRPAGVGGAVFGRTRHLSRARRKGVRRPRGGTCPLGDDGQWQPL